MESTSVPHGYSSPEIVARYRAFFQAHGHTELVGSPLAVPGNSTSFVIAGMQPLLPYLRGQQLPPSTRLLSLQRCLRSDDADAVGSNGRKNTFFFMLGNWSIGDYNKGDAIEMALSLLLEDFALHQSTLWVTVFAGDSELGIPLDETAVEHWLRLGIPYERIVPLGAEDNLWTMGGPGPCGPCSEIYVDRGLAFGCGLPTCRPGCACDRFLEVWNLVFMEYERFTDGSLAPLPQRNIDTGMGLERIASVLQGVESAFSIDLYQPALSRLNEQLSEGNRQRPDLSMPVLPVTPEVRARRVIVDHVRAALFAGLAGVLPGRDGCASVVRRLIRRAARQGHLLGLQQPFLNELVVPLAQAHDAFLRVEERAQVSTLARMIADEERRFTYVLARGLQYLAHLEPDQQGHIPGERLFVLHAEKGFPPDLAAEVLAERGLSVDWSSYEPALAEHRRISRLSAARHFGL